MQILVAEEQLLFFCDQDATFASSAVLLPSFADGMMK